MYSEELQARMAQLVRDVNASDRFSLSGLQTEARALLRAMEPTDPLTLRAREAAAAWLRSDREVTSLVYQAEQIEAGVLDNAAIMRLARFALGYEVPADPEWIEWTAPPGYYVPPTLGPCWVRNRAGQEWPTRGDQVDWRNVVVAYRLA